MEDSSSLQRLLHILLKECACRCSTNVSRDIQKINGRLKHEGISFLTITLPDFCRDFFIALEQGSVTPDLFVGWTKRSRLPAFLQGFTSQCFDTQTGRSLDEPRTQAIQAVRQICNLFKKIRFECSDRRKKKAFIKYEQTDNDLSSVCLSYDDMSYFRLIARLVTGNLFHDEIDLLKVIPHHGPGSTSEKLSGNLKYGFLAAFQERLRPWFNEDIFFNSEESLYLASQETYKGLKVEIQSLEEKEELPVRVVSVAKTLKSPRIIAMEPAVMQMAQQGVKDVLIDRIEKSSLTKGHINFTDQSINRALALENSHSRRLATLDLEEASDRVHNEFVRILFEANSDLCSLVQATRSKRAKLPDGRIINLVKFASMGSALCFPVEALYFFVLLILNGLKHKALLPTTDNIFKVSRNYYVYGDDLIIPVDEVDSAITLFGNFGCRVSKPKSFSKSGFRESCGMDAYNGVDITPIYIRNPIPSRKMDASAIISSIAACNQLYFKGYESTALFLKELIENVTGILPVVQETCAGLGWYFGNPTKGRLSKRYQRKEVLTFVIKQKFDICRITGYAALTKCIIKMELGNPDPFIKKVYGIPHIQTSDNDHLDHHPRRGALTLKRRWVLDY